MSSTLPSTHCTTAADCVTAAATPAGLIAFTASKNVKAGIDILAVSGGIYNPNPFKCDTLNGLFKDKVCNIVSNI